MNDSQRVSILSEALPYIQSFSGRKIVIKYGGSVMENDDLKKTVDYSKLVELLKDQSKKIYCFTIEKYSNIILEIIDKEFQLSKIKIILTRCNPPITGFDGKVSIVRILEKK